MGGGGRETTVFSVLWKFKNDCFGIELNLENNTIVMKCHILSTTARLFDPIVLLNPEITKAKICLQVFWLLKLNWEDFLSGREAKKLKRFPSEL